MMCNPHHLLLYVEANSIHCSQAFHRGVSVNTFDVYRILSLHLTVQG